MIRKTTCIGYLYTQRVKSIVFTMSIKFCYESGLTILNSLFPDRTRDGLFGV